MGVQTLRFFCNDFCKTSVYIYKVKYYTYEVKCHTYEVKCHTYEVKHTSCG